MVLVSGLNSAISLPVVASYCECVAEQIKHPEEASGITLVFNDMATLKASIRTIPYSYSNTAQITTVLADLPEYARYTRAWEAAVFEPANTFLLALAIAPHNKEETHPLIVALAVTSRHR